MLSRSLFVMARCLIGIGANLGDRSATVSRAVERLANAEAVTLLARSRNFETQPVGGPAGQPPYLNAAALIETTLSPERLLDLLQQIESDLGRQRLVRWGARVIDLDLLLYDQLELESPRLVLPHPRLAVRRFVLEPAAEIAAAMIHPAIGWTMEQLGRHLLEALPYAAIAGPPGVGKTWLANQLAAEPGRRRIDDVSPETIAAAAARPPESDSSGRGVRTEIEFLACRQRLLARDRWPASDEWAISDFWFDQSLAWSARLDATGQAKVQAAWQQAQSQVVPPKLLIVLQSPPPGDVESLRLSAALDALSRRPDVGPVLRLRADNRDRMLEEAMAALAAMK